MGDPNDTLRVRMQRMFDQQIAMSGLGGMLNELGRGLRSTYGPSKARWLLRTALRMFRLAAQYQAGVGFDRLQWRQRIMGGGGRRADITTKIVVMSLHFPLWGPTGDLP